MSTRDRMDGRWNIPLPIQPPKFAQALGRNMFGQWVYGYEENGIWHYYVQMGTYLDTWDGPKGKCPPRFRVSK